MSGDSIDPGLVTELHAQLEAARNLSISWQTRAQTALRLAESHGKELADLRATLAVDPTDLEHEAKSSAFWFSSWREMRRLRDEDKLRITGLTRDAIEFAARHDELVARMVTIADEAFGLGCVESAEDTLSRIEQGIFAQHQRDNELERRIQALGREVEALRCGDLMRFHDGELDPSRAERFREHLGRCEACQKGLVDHAQLHAQLSDTAKGDG
jgi:phage shock protein A